MADEKWISGLRGDMPVAAAAKLALGRRLDVVRNRLPAAVFEAESDIENVHQLRVGTRRAGAALRIFAELLPPGLYDKTRKSLRRLRRSAGAARDWDVFLADLSARLGKAQLKQRDGLVFLLGFARSQRDLAQESLRKAHDDAAEKFHKHSDAVAEHLGPSTDLPGTLRDLAGTMLSDLVRELETAAGAELQSYEALHRVRILGKQLRYAMEIFESCFARPFRDTYYPAVEEMQEILGLANDSHTACIRLEALAARVQSAHPRQWPRCKPGFDLLLDFHRRRLPLQRRKFERWWRAWLKSGAERAFVELIQGA